MFTCFRIFLCVIALAAIGIVATSISAPAADFYHNGTSLNHLGITGQSVNYNSALVRRDLNRQSRNINQVNRTEIYNGLISRNELDNGLVCTTED